MSSRSHADERILSQLQNVRHSGTGWIARCPGHDDRENSLSIGQGDDGQVLLHCFAGCDVERVVAALGLKMSDLSDHPKGRGEGGYISVEPTTTVQPTQPGDGCTLAQFAEAKQLPVDFLRDLGLTDLSYLGQPAIRIPYLGHDGAEMAVRIRVALTGENRFKWKNGAKPCLYGLSQLDSALRARYVALVEGESDCHTLRYHDIPALGIPGANSWRERRDAVHLDGVDTIYMVIEPDKGGETVKEWLATSKIRDRVRLVHLGKDKDPSGLYLADPERFRERWEAALDASISWAEHVAAEADARRQEAWELCRSLALQPRILDRFAEDLSQYVARALE